MFYGKKAITDRSDDDDLVPDYDIDSDLSDIGGEMEDPIVIIMIAELMRVIKVRWMLILRQVNIIALCGAMKVSEPEEMFVEMCIVREQVFI